MLTNGAHIRHPRFADNQWYPADPVRLEAALQTYLKAEPPPFQPDELVGLVTPHAGHRFSGHVAGAAFATLTGSRIDSVVLLGPDHRGAAPGRTSTPAANLWRTPLGDIPVGWELLEPIKRDIRLALLPDDDEHSLEIELPFLQVVLGQFRLVPLIMGDQSFQTAHQLSAYLVGVARRANGRPLFVASSDFSHFLDDATARQLDGQTINLILDFDAKRFADQANAARLHGRPLACGVGPIAAVMLAARALGATRAHLLKYATSADIAGDTRRVVGYAAIAFTKASSE
ncbi:MAG: MEMO1 family protein [Anaerolineae bacterium]